MILEQFSNFVYVFFQIIRAFYPLQALIPTFPLIPLTDVNSQKIGSKSIFTSWISFSLLLLSLVTIKILRYFYSLSYLHTICMLIYTLLRYLIIANYPLLLYLRYRKRNMKILVFEAEKKRPIPCCQLLFSHFQRRNAKKQLIPLRRETFSQAKKKER